MLTVKSYVFDSLKESLKIPEGSMTKIYVPVFLPLLAGGERIG